MQNHKFSLSLEMPVYDIVYVNNGIVAAIFWQVLGDSLICWKVDF
jgi:hypothetical protein